MTQLARYEAVPTAPAVIHGILSAALTAAVCFVIALALPFSGWHDDQSFLLWLPDVVTELHRVWQHGYGLWRVRFDLHDQLSFRLHITELAAVLAGLGCGVIKYAMTSIRDLRNHKNGRFLVSGKAAEKAAAGHLANKRLPSETNVPLLAPGVAWPRGWQVLNLLILGGIGSGKTRILLHLLDELLVPFRKGMSVDAGLFIYDTTGEITAGLPLDDADIAIVSADANATNGWAMSPDAPTVSDCESMAYQRGQSIKEGGIWEKGAITLDAGAMVLAHHEHDHWSAPELYEIALRDPIELKAAWDEVYPPAAKLIEIDPATGELSKTSASFILTWRANVLRLLRPLAESWRDLPPERMISFSAWLRGEGEQPRVIVVQKSGRHPAISTGWISMVMDAIASHAGDPDFAVDQNRRRIFVLDEAPTLGRLRRWPELLDIGRNKGLATIAVCQDLQQFRSTYGDVATSLLQRFRLKVVCEQTPGPDADEIANTWIGTRRVKDWTDHKASSKDEPKTETVPIVPAEHLSDRLGVSGGKVHALLVGLENVYRLSWPITIWPKRR